MNELIEVLTENTLAEILELLFALFVGSKWIYDSCVWFKGLLEKWRAKKNGEEKEVKSVEERLSLLETHDKEQGENLKELKAMLSHMQEQSVKDRIEQKRTTILDFADKALDRTKHPSKEKYNDIFAKYQEYEDILKENNLSNGQVEITIQMIRDSYRERLSNHTFMEDVSYEQKE